MNAFKRASLKLSHAVKHKTLSGGSTEEIVDESLDETFPASDPPGSTTTTDDQDDMREQRKKEEGGN